MRKINRRKLPIKTSNVLSDWEAKEYPSVTRWLSKLQAKKHSAFHLYLFCECAEMKPDELLKLKKDPGNKQAEKLLDTFMAEDTGLTSSAKFNCSIAVRSFFKHNYCDLAKAAGASQYEKIKPYWKPNKEDLKKLYRFCTNPRDRSILTLVCSTAIAKESLSNLKWKHFEENWIDQKCPNITLPPKLIKGHGMGKYKGVKQITFLTPEAKASLIEYKEWMEKKLGRQFILEENVYWTFDRPYKPLTYKPLGRVFSRLSKNSEVQFSCHDARRFVETGLEECRIPPNWARKIRGRKVRGEEAPYSRPNMEKLRTFYEEALSNLEFTSEKQVDREQEKVDNALLTLKLTRPELYELVMKSMEGLGKKCNLDELMKMMEEARECSNGNCQRIVEETELANYLQKGWRIVTALPSGKIVIDNSS